MGPKKNWAEYISVYNYIYRHKRFRFMRNVMHEVHMSEWVLIHFKITINLKFSMKVNLSVNCMHCLIKSQETVLDVWI